MWSDSYLRFSFFVIKYTVIAKMRFKLFELNIKGFSI